MASVSIWQNFDAHSAALKKRGATAPEISRLRSAAQAVEDAQAAASHSTFDPTTGLQPVSVPVLNWTIVAPTKEARAWAQRAVLCVTGGTEPSRGLGQLFAILAGLWALREVGDGRVDNVMRVISGDGMMASLVADLESQVRAAGHDAAGALPRLAEVYLAAMGFQLPAPVARALENYSAAVEAITNRLARSATSLPSARASTPHSSSGLAGKPTGAACRPPSSTHSLRRPTPAKRRKSPR